MSRLGITVEEFYGMSPRELDYALEDHAEQTKATRHAIFEAARLVCVTVRNAQITKPTSVIRKPEEYMPFPWEKEEVSQESLKDKLLGWAEMHNVRADKKKK